MNPTMPQSPRRWLFGAGLCFIAVSLVIYVLGWAQPLRSTDYLEQARQAIPWIRGGLLSSLCGFVLCLFGKKAHRLFSASGAAILFGFWLLIAESNF